MNLREYAQTQSGEDLQQGPVKSKRLKVIIENGEQLTSWGKDIIELNNEGYVKAVLLQLSLLQGYIKVSGANDYWESLTSVANAIKASFKDTPAEDLAARLTVTTLEYLQDQYKMNK